MTKTRRYIIGPFRFTFASGRLWASYSARNWGDTLIYKVKPMPADMSLAMHLEWFFQMPRSDKPYLTEFVGYHFPNVPEIQDRAAQLQAIAHQMPNFDYQSAGG